MAFKFFNSFLGWVVGLPPEFQDKNHAKAVIADAIRYGERFSNEGWAKYRAAADIAVNAGVLKECREDDGCFFLGNERVEKAYERGNAEFTAGKLDGIFNSRQEMLDVIKFAIYDNSRPECEICASARSYQYPHPYR